MRHAYRVSPYPALPEMESVYIAFTLEELEHITRYADGQPIDEFLRRVIFQTLT